MQGSHIKIRTNSELPVHVDGEPWIQAPGDIVVLKSALKVRPAAHTMTVNGRRTSDPGGFEVIMSPVVQRGASYLSHDFVMFFHASCEGLPGQ